MTPQDDRLLKRAERYVTWLAPRSTAILVAAVILTVVSGVLASRLQIRGSFADLLPPDRPSVQALDEVQERIKLLGSLFVVIESEDDTQRRQAVQAVEAALQKIDHELVGSVSTDPMEVASYLWDHRFLFVSTDDLERVLERLPEYVEERRRKANPLYIDFEDEPTEEQDEERERLERMQERLERAELRYESAKSGYISKDGNFQAIVIRTAFESSRTSKGRELVSEVRKAIKDVSKLYPLRYGITGDVITTLQEQDSIIRGMATAAGITILLVLISLQLYFRSKRAVAWIVAGLAVGSVVTFGISELIIGHLNIASAFLAAIVVGNGINPNIILIARFREEAARGLSTHEALAQGIAGAFRGTVAASLTAGVAYASLIATEFRGFRDFGIIGSLGMGLCWVAAFTVVPAIVVRTRASRFESQEPSTGFGHALARMVPEKRFAAVLVLGAITSVLAVVQTYRFVSGQPLEEDWRTLRSSSSALQETRYWNERMKEELVNAPNRYLAGRFLIATDSAEDASAIRESLKPFAGGAASEDDRLLAYLRGYDDAVPPNQSRKLELLAKVREAIDAELERSVPKKDRAMLQNLRPPDELETIDPEEVPAELTKAFVETDGSVGRTLVAAIDSKFDHWNVVQLVDFVKRFRKIDLPEPAVIGGQAFVFADMLASMERDGPIASGLALLGSFLAVLFIVGMRWHGVITLACAGLGTLVMIAVASGLGVKLNFLDFIALPLTIGIGVDYAANIAARDQQDRPARPRELLATTGGAVFLCSLTTTIGYGSLLLSDNAGIRSFGLAAIIGEIACGVIALILAPVFFAWLRRQRLLA